MFRDYRTFRDRYGVVHRTQMNVGSTGNRYLRCTGENLYGLRTQGSTEALTCLWCVVGVANPW